MIKKQCLLLALVVTILFTGGVLINHVFTSDSAYAQEDQKSGRVLFVERWNILPDKVEAYNEWTASAIRRSVAVPGVIEFRGFRPATGSSQVIVTFEFADIATWSAWYSHEDNQKVQSELHGLVGNLSTELWGPSPVVSEPLRPEGAESEQSGRVLYVVQYELIPDKAEAYLGWVSGAIPRLLAAPGIIALRAYRPAAGAYQIVATYEFADMAAWAAWYSHEDVQKVFSEEGRGFVSNVSTELWGPSPIVVQPVRPGS